MNAENIDAGNIDAGNIDAGNIDAENIDTENMDTENIDFGFRLMAAPHGRPSGYLLMYVESLTAGCCRRRQSDFPSRAVAMRQWNAS
jgi:hypothetical protein